MTPLEQKIELSQYLAYYGELLTDYQRQVFTLYNDCDQSLSELAEQFSVSKQAIRDLVHRVSLQLIDYEAKLHLVQTMAKLQRNSERVYQMAVAEGVSQELLSALSSLNNEIGE